MTVTYPLTLPSTPTPRLLRPDLFDAVPGTRDPYTGQEQLQAYPWNMQEFEVQLPAMYVAEAQPWIGALTALRGRFGTFFLGDKSWTLQGAGGGTPLVNGASQTGLSLITDGWPNSTLVLKAGDTFQIGSGAASELKRCMTDATTDGSGNVTIDVWPAIRSSPADDSAIVTTNPVGVFRLAENRRSWEADPVFFGISFRAVEAL